MKIQFLNILIVFVLAGCVTKYVEPLSSQATAQITFEREAKSPILGSTTFFVALDDSFTCDPSKGFAKQEKMATIDQGNPLIKNENDGAIRILAKDNFRFLVKTVAGFSHCDVVLGFKSEQSKSYILKAKTDLKSRETSCSVTVYERNAQEDKKVVFIEYQECKSS